MPTVFLKKETKPMDSYLNVFTLLEQRHQQLDATPVSISSSSNPILLKPKDSSCLTVGAPMTDFEKHNQLA